MTFTEAVYAIVRAERASVAYLAMERLVEADGLHPDDVDALNRALETVKAVLEMARKEAGDDCLGVQSGSVE